MSEKKEDQKKKSDQKRKSEEDVEVNFGLGAISFGGLFQGIRNVIDQVSKLEEQSEEANGKTRREGEVNGEREFVSSSGRTKAIYGFSVKTSLGGKTLVEPFGNVKRTPRGPVVEEDREPVVDIFNEQDHILIIVELPGVDEEHITTKVNGDILTLSAANGDRKYYKEVILPEHAATETLTSKYKNGILELRMSKK